MFELSTPFLHGRRVSLLRCHSIDAPRWHSCSRFVLTTRARGFASEQYCIDVLGNKDTAFFQFCNVMFIGVFFLVRICFGLMFSVHWAREQWKFLHTEPPPSGVDQFCCCYLYVAVRARLERLCVRGVECF
jgi:hypothetical protein